MSDSERGYAASGNTAAGFVVIDNMRARTIPIQQPYSSNKTHESVLARNVLEGIAEAARRDLEQHLWNFPLQQMGYTMPATSVYTFLAWNFQDIDRACVTVVPCRVHVKNTRVQKVRPTLLRLTIYDYL